MTNEERFKQLAGYVSDDDWNKLVNFTAQRILQRLAGVGLLNDAQPDQLQQAHDVVGTALVDFINVTLTCVAEGEAKV